MESRNVGEIYQGGVGEIDLNTEYPYWAWAEPHPEPYWYNDNQVYADAIDSIKDTDIWLVWYEGFVNPNLDVPVWTEHANGVIAHGCTVGGIFSIIDNLPAGWLYYSIDLAALDNYAGTIAETRLRVSTDSGGVNQGACIAIFDGTYQFVAWIRSDGLNIDGEVDVPLNMNQWRRVRLEADGTDCELFVDGESVQTGIWMNTTAEEKIVFGSYVQL